MTQFCQYISLLLISVFVIGCQENEPGPPPPPTKSAASAETNAEELAGISTQEPTTASSQRRAYGGLKFIVPGGWKEVPLSQMQMGILAAKFSMPDSGPDVVLTLSRSGGSLEDNINRWKGQFSSSRPPKTDTISVAGVSSTMIDLQGGFSPGMGRPDVADARMLGVIVPMEGQGYFAKLTGPTEQVSAVEEDFRSFLNSAAKE